VGNSANLSKLTQLGTTNYQVLIRQIAPITKFMKHITIVILALLLSACSLFEGESGIDGQVNLAIDWIEQPVFYTDSNPSIPSNLVRGRFYVSETGRYSFQYAYDDEFGWEGFYELQQAEPGQSGKFFRKDGRDGQSAYYTLLLSYRGASLDNYYEKSLASDNEYFIDEIIGGFRLIVHARRVSRDALSNISENKLSGEMP
jgi:hypothetical protein